MVLVLIILLNKIGTLGDGTSWSLEWKVYEQVISTASFLNLK